MTISTHVLDASAGRPAMGLSLRLFRVEGADLRDATEIGSGTTNDDGRCPELTDAVTLTAGVYRLRFETGAWFARTGTPSFYPVAEITFEVVDPTAHHHVPLLLSPFAYSTYRGS
jgi:5-hydroxyisourate hydrolase